jgi:eukaryotic-like serine/threonine-protein kinase
MQAVRASDVQEELEKILASPAFAKSPRMSRFLRFVVQETIEGRSERIKEYAIALEVFDKDDTYDPQADSTVRTEASKLRSRLTRYYETDGRESAVIISIPKGGYVPAFEVATPDAAPVARPRRLPWIAAPAAIALLAAAWLITRDRPVPPPPTLRQLTSFPELEEHPSLSPDGSRVAFSWKGDIYVKRLAGDDIFQVTSSPAKESSPAWSPDGRDIAFIREGGVFLTPALGGGAERKVIDSPGPVVWMPDGSALLVACKGESNGLSICMVSLSTGQKKLLTFPHQRSIGDVDMAVSPDGRMLAFKRVVVQNGELYVMPLAGGSPRQLTNDGRPILGLAWTPDGKELVFSSARSGWSRLWRIPVQAADNRGSFPTPKLVEGAGDDARFPSISVSAAKLVYERFTRNFDVRRAEITGSEGDRTHALKPSIPLIASTRMDYTPAISPDGKRVAFVSDRSGARELWVCDIDGANAVKLTSLSGPDVVAPRWSPDGQRIVFTALSGPMGNFEAFTISAGGGTPERLEAAGNPAMAHPVFSPDGQSVYFINGPLGKTVDLWRMPSTGGNAVRITTNGAFRPEPSPDGKLIYYGKRLAKQLWAIPAEGGEEHVVLEPVAGFNWTVRPKGIYYFDFGVPPGAPKLVNFYSFRTGSINRVGVVESNVSTDFSGISVSPDGRWLLYSHEAATASDLMLLDGFR